MDSVGFAAGVSELEQGTEWAMYDNPKGGIGGLETQVPYDGIAIGAVEDRQCLARNSTSDPKRVAGHHTNRVGCCVWVSAREV
jgi:hypothetical protein